jgi:hypothetical protein
MSARCPLLAGLEESSNRLQRLASALHFSCLLVLTLACTSSTGPKLLSMEVLPGSYVGIGTGAYFDPPGPRLLYESPSLKVEAVSASVMIAGNLTYTFSAVYRVTRAAAVTTVEWKNSGDVRPRAPSPDTPPSDDQYLYIELVENGSSTPVLRGVYTAPICLSGFGLSVSLDSPCTNTPATIGIPGVIPRNLIPDGPDINFYYKMDRW